MVGSKGYAFKRRVRKQSRQIQRKLEKKKQTILNWLGSGVSHYYMKFLGLWKPEGSMGIISDIMQMQEEQHRVLMGLTAEADMHRNFNENSWLQEVVDKQDLWFVFRFQSS